MHVTPVPPTSANVNITVAKNTSFSDALMFGEDGDTTWSFTDKTFHMGVKGNLEQESETITFLSAASEIIVDDEVRRILHFNVPDATLQAALIPGLYIYTLLMTDTDTGIVTQLMHGEFNYADAV